MDKTIRIEGVHIDLDTLSKQPAPKGGYAKEDAYFNHITDEALKGASYTELENQLAKYKSSAPKIKPLVEKDPAPLPGPDAEPAASNV